MLCSTNGIVVGVVAVDPPHCPVLAANSLSSPVPVLVILSWNEQEVVDKNRQLYLVNPHVIRRTTQSPGCPRH
jgi:hypothetical protein